MKKRKPVPVHTATAGTVVEILKALGISKKKYKEVVKEIQRLESNNYEPFPIR